VHIRPIAVGLIGITLSVVASVHAISTKREVRGAIGWMGLIWLVPFGGAALYALLGVNRIRRRGGRISRQMHSLQPDSTVPPMAFGTHREAPPVSPETSILARPPDHHPSLAGLLRTGREVTGLSLVDGNRIQLLIDGDETYPAMLEAIRSARDSIGLSTYIFDTDEAGEPFIEALADAGTVAKAASNWVMGPLMELANQRGVEVSVLPVTAEGVAELLALVADGTISHGSGKDVLALMTESDRSAAEIVEAEGMVQVADEGLLEGWIHEVIAAHPDEARRYREGEDKLLGFFVGRVMRASQGKADPRRVNGLLRTRL